MDSRDQTPRRDSQTLIFDADDTLWQNEQFYHLTHRRFADLLGSYSDAEALDQRLLEAETRNVGLYGFGVKSFTLSMIETAIDVLPILSSVSV